MKTIRGKMEAALRGLRVLELTRVGPGAFCTRVLGDMGAEVIKIEEPFRKILGGIGRERWRRAAFDRNKKSCFVEILSNLKTPITPAKNIKIIAFNA